MPKPITFGKLEVGVVSTMEETQAVPEPETPFRILIMGDFSGRANRGLCQPGAAMASRRPVLVDRDNFDAVLAKLGVEVHLPLGGGAGPPVIIKFSELDDFHPDRLYERLEVFQALREMRQLLKDPATFASVAAELQNKPEQGPAETSNETPAKPNRSAPEIPSLSTGDLLDEVLDKTPSGSAEDKVSRGGSEWDRFLQETVAPYLVPDTEPQQAKLIAGVDAAVAELMRTILHHPDFQAIEAAWRGLYFLVSRLETDSHLKLYLVDISREELAADLNASEDLRSSGICKLLVEKTVETFGADPWTVFAGDYTFIQTKEDAELLGRMAKIASRAGAPFIAAAGAGMLGCGSLAETPDPDDWQPLADEVSSAAWASLRGLPEANYIGLVLPRFLLRLPYGSETDPAEHFDFEEMSGLPVHNDYLWGNPAMGCVYLLARAFSRQGWNLRPGVVQDIEDLPLHVYDEQGESRLKPCAEVVLTERAMVKILDKGLMPLLSMKNRDVIRLARFQSLALPPKPLAGRWMFSEY
jgi:type VI secretion system protein ImpC